MIKLNNIHKYYNKRKSNEIHVINNASLTLPDTGLVCFLGPSGCGKTTLLNAIGGLDKVDSGTIEINGQVIKRYQAKNWDEVRYKEIGCIFQNYVLLPDMSVFDNIALSLSMFSLTKEEIAMRIEYALKAVGMDKYQKRKAKQLSGGQMQRIAIARALAKSPAIIIADEPTGNLDEKNTHQIMHIIKKISQECLVILVTHEQSLASFYGDRIIELLDGQIVNDVVNIINEGDQLSYNDNNLYLQDFKKEELHNDNVNINYFFRDKKINLDLNVIYENNTLYVNVNKSSVKVKFITSNDEVKIINGHKPVIKKANLSEFDYHLASFSKSSKRRHNFIKLKETIRMSFNYLKTIRFRQKIMLFSMFLSAIIIVIAFSTLFKSNEIKEEDFMNVDRNIIEVNVSTKEDAEKIKENLDIDTFYYRTDLINGFKFDVFTPEKINIFCYGSVLPDYLLKDSDYICRLENSSGVVVDRWLIDNLLGNGSFDYSNLAQAGGYINSPSDYQKYLGLNCYNFYDYLLIGPIVGIVDTKSPSYYLNIETIKDLQIASLFFDIRNNMKLHDDMWIFDEAINYDERVLIQSLNKLNLTTYQNLSGQDIDISSLTLAPDEILIDKETYDKNKFNYLNDKINILGTRYTIVGTFMTTNNCLVAMEDIDDVLLSVSALYSPLTFYAKDKQAALSYLQNSGYYYTDLYEISYRYYKESIARSSTLIFIFSIVVLSISVFMLYFLMRSRVFSRIYEIGVYRALGIRKNDIYKIFITEIFFLTLFSSMIGYFLIVYIMTNTQNTFFLNNFLVFNWMTALTSLATIWILNLLIGLWPITRLLRLTPAEILAKYDI